MFSSQRECLKSKLKLLIRKGELALIFISIIYRLRKHLPTEIQLVGDVIDEDDIHMILEYKTGETWGPFTAPRANRFIVHNDHRNPFLQAVEWLEDALKNFQPRLLVVSGIQMMDTFKFEPGKFSPHSGQIVN